MIKAKSLTANAQDIAELQESFEDDEGAVQDSLKGRLFGGSSPIVKVMRKRVMKTANTMDD